MSDKGIYRFTNNATVAAVIGALVGGVLGYVAKDIQVHDAVTYNNITSYIESMLVDPGYVSEEVLKKETPFDQIEFIGQDVSGKLKESKSEREKMAGSVRSFLVDSGEDVDSVEKMDDDKLRQELSKKSSEFKTTKSELEKAEEKNREYEKLTLAELKTPEAVIDGEQYSNPVQGYQAVINGHNYYADEFLNSFLEFDLVCEDNTLYYHKGALERVRVIDSMYYDQDGYINVLSGDEIYTMELEEYRDGLKINYDWSSDSNGEIKISCRKEYSSIEFKAGHIDNGDGSDKDITILYQDDEGKYVSSQKIHCTGDMPVKTYTIPIYNTQTVKITSVGHGDYLLTDIYLIR